MAAEAIAAELALPLYRIDLSQVVNKYIGETEKNLRRLFDAADAADVILFFDEADALFGKRTEVKDAHDRYANLEVSYLLERMERFKGLAILATNRKKDLDEAFLRRLRFVVEFPLPGVAERLRIWRSVIPPGVDASALDFEFLAQRFPLAGGHIRAHRVPRLPAERAPTARRARSTMPADRARRPARVRQARPRQQPRPVRPLRARWSRRRGAAMRRPSHRRASASTGSSSTCAASRRRPREAAARALGPGARSGAARRGTVRHGRRARGTRIDAGRVASPASAEPRSDSPRPSPSASPTRRRGERP